MAPVTDREVLEENYGVEPLYGVGRRIQTNQVVSVGMLASARMLVYIRETAIDVLTPVTEQDIPPNLSKSVLGWWMDDPGSFLF